MLILILEPMKPPVSQEIGGGLKDMQKIVGGTVQAIYPFEEEVALLCNDDAKLLGLPANRGLRDEDGVLYDIVCGTCFLCGAPAEGGRFQSLTPEQVQRYTHYFRYPEIFIKAGDKLLCLPLEV